jgi:low affinity Fe/Cu permease
MKHKSLVLVLAVVVSLLLTSFPMAQNINNDIFAENQTYDANLNAWTEQELSADVVDLEPLREK